MLKASQLFFTEIHLINALSILISSFQVTVPGTQGHNSTLQRQSYQVSNLKKLNTQGQSDSLKKSGLETSCLVLPAVPTKTRQQEPQPEMRPSQHDSKYTRVPPPKYRPHLPPSAQRMAVSPGQCANNSIPTVGKKQQVGIVIKHSLSFFYFTFTFS